MPIFEGCEVLDIGEHLLVGSRCMLPWKINPIQLGGGALGAHPKFKFLDNNYCMKHHKIYRLYLKFMWESFHPDELLSNLCVLPW